MLYNNFAMTHRVASSDSVIKGSHLGGTGKSMVKTISAMQMEQAEKLSTEEIEQVRLFATVWREWGEDLFGKPMIKGLLVSVEGQYFSRGYCESELAKFICSRKKGGVMGKSGKWALPRYHF